MSIYDLPAVNASLNAACTVLLLTGYFFIRRRKIVYHRACMVAAFVCSTVFLILYLYFHFHAGVIRFGGQGWIRPVYFGLLLTHTTLAVVIVPLVLITLGRAWRGRGAIRSGDRSSDPALYRHRPTGLLRDDHHALFPHRGGTGAPLPAVPGP